MLSLILPTYNEAENLPILLPKIAEALRNIPHEVIIVDDDSPDGTWDIAHRFADQYPNLHIIRRIGRRGLSSAVVEGFLAANGNILAVADADGQHDLSLLPQFYEAVVGSLPRDLSGEALLAGRSLDEGWAKSEASAVGRTPVDIAIGSRYIEGGSVVGWDERRYALSRIATHLAMLLCRVEVRDPMSGFFAIRRQTFEHVLSRLNPKGFKILLDILVHVPKTTTVREIPFTFGKRLHGESKLSRRVQIEFLEYLYDVTFGRYIPLTFLKYCIVGALGVIVHLTAYLLIRTMLAERVVSLAGFSVSILVAVETAILFNFTLNNLWTFSHARLHGLRAFFGFLKFNAACAIGALANYGVSAFLFSRGWHEILSVAIGAFVGIFWNYTMNRLITWRE